MKRNFMLWLVLLVVGSCAMPPKGGDVDADIKSFSYQNRPRVLPPNATEALFTPGRGGATIASIDIPWQVPAGCRGAYRAWLTDQSNPVADQTAFFRTGQCRLAPKRGFVGIAISGGGNKSAVYAAEILFELGRYGLTEEIDAISSVSGGSFTAMLFGLSCDPPQGCTRTDAWRPKWDYPEIRRWIETNYLWAFIGHRFRPDNLYHNLFEHHGAADDLASVVGTRLLRQTDRDLTFQDLNPERPNLIINATNVTESRSDFDRNAPITMADRRPLADDDALHFAFTQQYFWRLLADLNTYPLKEAVAASAAFPLIIDRPSLRQYRIEDLAAFRAGTNPTTPPKYIALYDGGVHDNFGVTELQWFMECQLQEPAGISDPGDEFYRHECGTAKKSTQPRPAAALIFGINSSLLRSDGVPYEVPKQRDFDTYVLPIRISGVEESVNMIMAASGEQRRQQLRRLMRNANPSVLPTGYTRYDPENPELRYGPFQYIDFDIEAAQVLYCYSGDPANPGKIDRQGRYQGPAPSSQLLNRATGGSDKSRCDALQGVLRWNDDAGPEGRNLQLPTVQPGFCSAAEDCRELEPLVGERKLMAQYVDGKPTDRVDLTKIFFDPDNHNTPRLLRNSLLFDAVHTVPTDFKLSRRYAWLLRYTARWVVAHRIWRLCHDNGPLLDVFGKYQRVCKDKLPDRSIQDEVGGDDYRASRP
jgi:hypothetical protein